MRYTKNVPFFGPPCTCISPQVRVLDPVGHPASRYASSLSVNAERSWWLWHSKTISASSV